MTKETDVKNESIIERGRRARFFINEVGEEPGEARITDEALMRASVAFGQMERNGWLKIIQTDRDWDLDEPHCVVVIAANFTDAAPSTPQRAKLFAAALAAARSNEARDRLIDDMTVSRAHLVGLLRDAQAQRDRLANETLTSVLNSLLEVMRPALADLVTESITGPRQRLCKLRDEVEGWIKKLEAQLAAARGIAEAFEKQAREVEISDMGRTARFQDAAIEALQKRVDDRDAEIARMRAAADSGAPDCDSCAAWDEIRALLTSAMPAERHPTRTGATPAPSMRRTVVMVRDVIGRLEQAREGLRVEEGKVAKLTEELARRLAQVAEARVAEFEPGSIAAYEQGIRDRVLEIPGVLRVHWPQWGTLRAIVAVAAEVPNHRESLEMQIEAAIDDPEIEHRVQEEPGEPAPGYVVRGGEAASAAAPDLRWFWRHSSDDQEHEQGPLASEAAAVDATWDEHAIDTAEEMPSHAGDEP